MNERSQIVWDDLVKAAKAGAPCPTSAELSKIAGYSHVHSAQNPMRRWRKDGKIAIENRGRWARRVWIDGNWTDWSKPVRPRKRGAQPSRDYRTTISVLNCLSCGGPFPSGWSGERVCKRCKATAIWRGNAIAI